MTKPPFWKRKFMIPVYVLVVIVIVGALLDAGDDNKNSDTATLENAATSTAADATGGENATGGDNAPESTQAAPASRENPLPIGVSVEVTAETIGDADGSVWSLRVTGEAQDLTQSAMSEGLAQAPAEGNVIVGVPFELTLVSARKEPLAPLFNVETKIFSPTNPSLADSLLACGFLKEAFDSSTEVFIGGTISGLLCAEVPAADLNAGLLVTADEEGDRVFLATG